jgi:hypothetical protein
MALLGRLHPLLVHSPIALVLIARRGLYHRRCCPESVATVVLGVPRCGVLRGGARGVAGHFGAVLVWGAAFLRPWEEDR